MDTMPMLASPVSAEGGYTATFVADVPDYLKCSICLYVLREPVMLVECGHKFCKECFEEVKRRVLGSVRCPMDRTKVNLRKVFDDKSTARAVLDLHVKCERYTDGCLWTGELRNAQDHLNKDCSFEEKKRNSELLKELKERVDKCEGRLLEKDLDLIITQQQQMQKEKETTDLKGQLHAQIVYLRQEFEDSQRQLSETKHELASLKDQCRDYNIMVEQLHAIVTKLPTIPPPKPEQIATTVIVGNAPSAQNTINRFPDVPSTPNDSQSMKRKRAESSHIPGNTTTSQIPSNTTPSPIPSGTATYGYNVFSPYSFNDNPLAFQDYQLMMLANEADQSITPSTHTHNLLHQFDNFCRDNQYNLPYNDFMPQQLMSDAHHKPLTITPPGFPLLSPPTQADTEIQKINTQLETLRSSISEIKKILYNQNIAFKWHLTEYESRKEMRDAVFSPLFYNRINGSSCQLSLRWKNEGGIDLEFVLYPFCIDAVSSEELKGEERPVMDVKLEILDSVGYKEQHIIPASRLSKNTTFTFENFLQERQLESFIVDDSLYITCTLEPYYTAIPIGN